jgi:hypothetical protein
MRTNSKKIGSPRPFWIRRVEKNERLTKKERFLTLPENLNPASIQADAPRELRFV